MPNGGGAKDRIGAILGEAFVTRRKLSSGARLPLGGRVDFVGERNLAAVPDRTRPPDVEIRFRVVSAAFDGLSSSERTSLVREVLADGANPRSELNPHLGRGSIRLTGRAEGEFDFGYEVVVIEARTHSEAGEVEPRPKHALGASENLLWPCVLAGRKTRRQTAATSPIAHDASRRTMPRVGCPAVANRRFLPKRAAVVARLSLGTCGFSGSYRQHSS